MLTRVSLIAFTLLLPLNVAPVWAQGSPVPGSPVPGGGQAPQYRTAPNPGIAPIRRAAAPATSDQYTQGASAQNYNNHISAPIPGEASPAPFHVPNEGKSAGAPRRGESLYQQLPISAEEARIRIEDLSNRLAVSRPDDVKDGIYTLSEWLQDVADAHWRLFKAFEKSDATKVQANKEKDIALKFSSLKNRAKLLKADLLIKQNRYPEALGPLVEIVSAEPTSQTGQDAYKRLVDMGFSEQVSNLEVAEKGINGGKH